MDTTNNIIRLREQMALDGIDAFIVYTADPHNSEYPADHRKFREYLSGFNGSAGTVVVTKTTLGYNRLSLFHTGGKAAPRLGYRTS